MIKLPDSPRRSEIRAFGLSLILLSTLVSGAAAGLAGASLPGAWAAGCAAATASILLGSDTAAMWTYAGWNRIAQLVSRGARLWITGVTFLVITVVGRAGSRLPSGPRSGWVEKTSLNTNAFAAQGREAIHGSTRDGWLSALTRWGRHGHGWVWGLLPFLALLSVVHQGDVRAPTDRNYTLY